MARESSSLLVRTTAVLAGVAIAIAGTAILALNAFVIAPISEQSADDEAALLVLSAQTWVELPPSARPYFELELAENHDLIISPKARDLPPADLSDGYLELLQLRLSERLERPTRLRAGDDLVWADIPMGGYEMQIGLSPARREVQPLNVALIIAVMGALIVTGVSLLVVRRVTRPLVDAARRVESFRGGEQFEPLPEEGPREIVTLARSFNTMARDISALLSNRTTLLAGISHDLRTPLARMRLALELLPESVDRAWVERFERNLATMDELIGDAMRFARGTFEVPAVVDLRAFLTKAVAGLDDQVACEWCGDGPVERRVATGALRRVLQNLLANARQHGGGTPCVRVDCRKDVEIHVIDRGPGIPLEQRDAVFQPFFRLDRSRSQKTGGSGLGLAIVLQLCQTHGWRIEIRTAEPQGTDVVLTLDGEGKQTVTKVQGREMSG
jgi:two-component system osmolarity sensor histidine kinase EnvZ